MLRELLIKILKIMCCGKSIRGEQGPQGIQGEQGGQGEQGPQGDPGANWAAPDTFLQTVAIPVVAAPVDTNIDTSAVDGTLFIWGFVTVTDSIGVNARIDIIVNAVAVPNESISRVSSTDCCIPVTVSSAIQVGDLIDFRVTMSAYSGNASVTKATLFYFIA